MSEDRADSSRGIPQRCETDGCHRTATLRLVYTVWRDGATEGARGSCQPCANAMRFREQFDQARDSWRAEEVR